MKKNFVLDTNVVLHDPTALLSFEDNNVVLPLTVIEEIDQFKKQLDELGRNARTVSREIDKFRKAGSLSKGVVLPRGGLFRVLLAPEAIPRTIRTHNPQDDLILAVALHVSKSEPDLPMVFITMDTNMRIRADALGLAAEDYEKGHVKVQEVFTGHGEAVVEGEFIDRLHKEGTCGMPPGEYAANQFLTLKDELNPSHSALARVVPSKEGLMVVRPTAKPVWGIRPKNREQAYAMNLLLDDAVSLVTLVGKAGTGKTLIAVACGLSKVTDEQRYDRLLVSRPIFPLGKDLGFLPGTVEQKLNPWMQPIHDSIAFLMSSAKKRGKEGREGRNEMRGGEGRGGEGGMRGGDGTSSYGGLKDLDLIQVEPLTYIRGRSIPNQFMIVDEAQNLTPHEVKTILTRAGEGTKIVLTGDPYQIDHPYLDSLSNGLAYVVARFRDVPIAGTVTLERGERSQLAEFSANRL